MKSIIIIPARYSSTRFPGKVIAELLGKTVIQRVYEKASGSGADRVLVATDSEKVLKTVESFGAECVMTSASHVSGSDRVWEAYEKSGSDADLIVNLQGDEPLLPSAVIDSLLDAMRGGDTDIATVAVPVSRGEFSEDANAVKVVLGRNARALYFSRAGIPFLRDGGKDAPMLLHWGIYAYTRDSLKRFVSFSPSRLENCEKLEQLRALENGMEIRVVTSAEKTVGIDTPEDFEVVRKILAEQEETD